MTKSIPQARKEQKKRNAKPDWSAIERDYRAGIKTLRAIATEHGDGISHVAITKRATKEGWTRSLTARIQAKTEAIVNKSAVNSRVTKADEKAVIDANAQLQANIITSQRTDIGEARAVVRALLAELGAGAIPPDAIEVMVDWHVGMTSDDDEASNKRKERLFEAIMKSLDMPQRIASMQKLADSLTKLVTLERVVFGIDKDTGGETIEERLKRLID